MRITDEITEIIYETPEIMDHGSIADNTFDNPGQGDKSSTVMGTDKWGEYSHPFVS